VNLLLAPDRSAAALAADPGPRRTTLPNGLTVLSEHVPRVRSVAFGAFVRAGSLHEPRERMGVSHLLEHMVFKGTPTRTARQLSFELETLGGSLDAYTTREYTSYQARVLAEHLGVAADVIGDLVFRPLLRDEDLALERNVILEEIGMVEDTPDDLVFERHHELLWGAHPYGYSILGTRDTVAALTADDLRALHRAPTTRRTSWSPPRAPSSTTPWSPRSWRPAGATRARATRRRCPSSAPRRRRPRTSTWPTASSPRPTWSSGRRRRRTTTTAATRSRW
jgi:hypothetical protein